MNAVILAGNLVNDPDLRFTPSGYATCRFTLATHEPTRSGKYKTVWHSVVSFGAPAELLAKTIKEGQMVVVEGKLSYREWDNKGTKMKVTEVVADLVRALEAV